MTLSEFLQHSKDKLAAKNIPTARLDCLVLLEDTINKDRAWLLAHPEFELNSEQTTKLNEQIKRRSKHEPLAYIRGKTEFYGRELMVNQHTLEPRPETETIIEMLRHLMSNEQIAMDNERHSLKIEHYPLNIVVDVGTGSGAIAITAKILFPKALVYGTDIDNKCIQTARANAKKHGASIDFRQGNLLEPLKDELASDWIIIANLPYVPDSHTINKAAMFEPKHSIFGGSDGLDLYREMFMQIDKIKCKPNCIISESLPFQHKELSVIASKSGYKQQIKDDFIQVFMLSE